jgi:NADH-quinone oxidoreductase subunit H
METTMLLFLFTSLLWAFFAFGFVMVNALALTLAERKLLGWMQQRLGPMEVGPWGLLQPVADMIKLLTKGDVIPKAADKFFYSYSSLIAFTPSFVTFALIPFGSIMLFGSEFTFFAVPSNVGILFLSAVMALSVIGVILGGWSSGNKFSLLGAFRTAAQEISYELPKTFALLAVVMMAQTMNIGEISSKQALWFIVPQFIGFLVFFISSLAEIFRIPFDLAEGESELVAGYNVEFAGIRFAFFFFAEYTYLFITSAIITALYLGGGSGFPFLPSVAWFLLKTFLVVGIILWLSRSMPRVRPDQLMNMAWKVLIPLSIINIIWTSIIINIDTIYLWFVK